MAKDRPGTVEGVFKHFNERMDAQESLLKKLLVGSDDDGSIDEAGDDQGGGGDGGGGEGGDTAPSSDGGFWNRKLW